jgi:hypothetical protein
VIHPYLGSLCVAKNSGYDRHVFFSLVFVSINLFHSVETDRVNSMERSVCGRWIVVFLEKNLGQVGELPLSKGCS